MENKKSKESLKQAITETLLTVMDVSGLKEMETELSNGEIERCYGVKFEKTEKRDLLEAIEERLLTV